MSQDELEAIRTRYENQLKEKETEVDKQMQVEKEKQVQSAKQNILRRILTEKAKNRLINLRLVKPKRAELVEMKLIQLYQTSRLTEKISEEQLLSILKQLSANTRNTKIEFRRP